ncbi:hypothetical protein PPACK8108_LOCUS23938 [Phakopsora pachyrhizi]|uniref:Carrier domain-containing protein n=1 Tax=Phakopsora pachyrhizi TaxID=170000 RepID=A0AAV0BNQ3_PHAPC|nr:hypothetical protein PPACK8108_LOCUS23938 [Phakopsora pachyrhizi]
MATRTLKLKFENQDTASSMNWEILCISKNMREICYHEESASPALPASAPVVVIPVPSAAAAVTVAATAVSDEPPQAVQTLQVLVAQGLEKPLEEVPLSKSIKDLVGGKSTMQNKLLDSAQAKFGLAPDKAEEMPLSELSAALQANHAGTVGKHTSGLVSPLVGSKMPGGFVISAVKAHLTKAWGLGPGRIDGVLLMAVTMEPPKRLGSEGDTKTFLDTTVEAYGKQQGITLNRGGTAAAGGANAGGAVINSEEFEKFQQNRDAFVSQQLEVQRILRMATDYMTSNKRNSCKFKNSSIIFTKSMQIISSSLYSQVDDFAYIHLSSIFGCLEIVDRDITAKCLVIMNRANSALIDYMQYYLDNIDASKGEHYRLAKEFGHTLLMNCREAIGTALYRDVTFPTAPKTTVTLKGEIIYEEVNRVGVSRLERYLAEMAAGSKSVFNIHPESYTQIASAGTTLEHKNALLTGVGKASIGVKILKGLLSGRAHVIFRTSRYSRATVEYYQGIYQEVGSRGSRLTVVLFNEGSKQDVEGEISASIIVIVCKIISKLLFLSLVNYIYSTDKDKGLAMDLYNILPLSAIPENGREIDGLDDRSELADRVMLTNLIAQSFQKLLWLTPHHQLHPKHVATTERIASQHHLQHLQHQQQQQQQAAIARQQMQQQEMRQQRQSEALLHQQVFQQHQIYPECHATQQQILANGRHPGVIKNVPQEQSNGLAPHPPAQQGSPLNPHPQPFWASRPPSRSGVTQASSTFGASNHLQLQPLPCEPSQGSNQDNSPANQANPRTPSFYQPAPNMQTAVLPLNRHSSPIPTSSTDKQD